MGATDFLTSAKRAEVREAYNECVDRASYEYGHGGYSGTIAEKNGYVVITTTPMPRPSAETLAYELINTGDPRVSDKWGPAGAIPFIDVDNAECTRVATLSFAVPGGLDWEAKEKHIRAEVDARLKLKAGEQVLSVRTTKDEPGPVKVKAVATTGKAVTKYIVQGTRRQSWATGFNSQAEARAYAVQYANEVDPQGRMVADLLNLGVESVTRRQDGQPLVIVTREVTKRNVEVNVSILTAMSKALKAVPDGWLFFGMASC